MSLDLDKASEDFDRAIKNMSQEDIDKYFPKDTTPKGWVDIEKHLPMVTIDDVLNNDGLVKFIKVKYKDGNESESQVGDHNTWYYYAKEEGITHWWND